MPDITLCENKDCLLRDNCKRGLVYNDEKPNQSWFYVEPVSLFDENGECYPEYRCKCEFQIEIN